MSDFPTVPAGWSNASVSDVAEYVRGVTYQKTQAVTATQPRHVPVLRANNLLDDFNLDNLVFVEEHMIAADQMVRANDIVFAMSSGSKSHVGKSVLAKRDMDCAFGAFCGLLRPISGIVPAFVALQFYGRKFRRYIEQVAGGTNINNLKSSDLMAYQLVLAPEREQHRIVAKIEVLFSEIDKGVESLTTAREQLKVYRQAVLKHAFEGKLTADWRANNPESSTTPNLLSSEVRVAGEVDCANDLSALPLLPGGWTFVRAESIMGFITKGTTPSKELLRQTEGEIPFVKVYNLTRGGFLDFSIDPTFVSRQTHRGVLARSKVYPGDVLMNIVGPPLGKVSIVPDTHGEWNVNQAIAIFRSKFMSPRLLAMYLASESTVRAVTKKAKATAGQFNLTLEICRNIPIPLCGPEEQKELELLLETKLSQLENIERTIETALKQIRAIRQAILKRAFSGQLVSQDPNDEPASVLLDRIRAEKEATATNKQKPKKLKAQGAAV